MMRTTKELREKTAEIFGIENNEMNILTTNHATPIISKKIAEEKGFINKLKINWSSEFAIRDNNGKYISQWCEIKKNRKEYKKIMKFIDTLDIYTNKYGLRSIPSVKDIVLDTEINIKGKYYRNKNYGVFFIIEDADFESETFKTAFNTAVEWKLSDFYKIKENDEK